MKTLHLAIFLIPLLWASCRHAEQADVIDTEFHTEKEVVIKGYYDDAMEPFITKDDKYLFFNSNYGTNAKEIYYAEKINDTLFVFKGEVKGVNSEEIDANPTMDQNDNFFFMSTRDIDIDGHTLFKGTFDNGTVSNIEQVQGSVNLDKFLWFNMGVEISTTGDTMLISSGRFSPWGVFPNKADIHLAIRENGEYNIAPDDEEILQNINTSYGLEYAGEMSADGLELFYSQAILGEPTKFKLYHAKRKNTNEPFDKAKLINVPFIDNEDAFVEAPTLSADGKRLYYHKLDGERFKIFVIFR